MTNSVDPDQMASSESGSGSTLFANVGVVVNSRIRVKPFCYIPTELLLNEQQDKTWFQ